MKLDNKGLSLIELLAILLLIGIIVGIISPIVTRVIEKSKVSKIENSFETLARTVQHKHSGGNVQYNILDGVITPEIEYAGKVSGTGSLTVDLYGNIEVKVDSEGYCVYKSALGSRVRVQRGACQNLELGDFELLIYRGLATNHSLTVITDFSGIALEYYFKINDSEWLSNETIGQNYYVFENLTHNTAYELRAKAITQDGSVAMSDALLMSTVNVATPILGYVTENSKKYAVVNFDEIKEGYIYRYRLDDGLWHTADEAVEKLELSKNNSNIIGEILDEEGNSMIAVNQVINYQADAQTPALTVKSVQNGAVSDKYVVVDYGERDNYFTYRYKLNNGDLIIVSPNEGNAEVLIPANNSTVYADVIDPAGEIMQHNSINVPYYDDTEYTITLVQGDYGQITSNRITAKVGDAVTLTTTPITNYTINTLTYNGISIKPSTDSSTIRPVTFTMPRSNVEVVVTWKIHRVYYVQAGNASFVGNFTVGRENIGTGAVSYDYGDSGDYWRFASNQATSYRSVQTVNLTNISRIYFTYYRYGAYYDWGHDGTFRVLLDNYTSGWCGGGYTPRNSWQTASINVASYTGNHTIVIEVCNSGVYISDMYGQ